MLTAKDIIISTDDEIMYDQSIVYTSYPRPVANVNLMLVDTTALIAAVDAQRMEKGYLPMLPQENGGECDESDWYRFYINLNDYNDAHVDTSIEATVQSGGADDDFASYYIDLTEAEQRMVYAALDEQLRKIEGKTAEEMLAEAKKYMEEG